MICNIGYVGGGRNFNNKKLLTKRSARLFDMKTYEYDYTWKHPEYVIECNRYKDLVLDSLGGKIYYLIRLREYYDCLYM